MRGTYVEKAELRADVEDPAGGRGLPEQRQQRFREHLGAVEVGPEDRLGVLHRVGVDLVEGHGRVVHLLRKRTERKTDTAKFSDLRRAKN